MQKAYEMVDKIKRRWGLRDAGVIELRVEGAINIDENNLPAPENSPVVGQKISSIEYLQGLVWTQWVVIQEDGSVQGKNRRATIGRHRRRW